MEDAVVGKVWNGVHHVWFWALWPSFGEKKSTFWELDSVVETVNIALEIYMEVEKEKKKKLYLCFNSKMIYWYIYFVIFIYLVFESFGRTWLDFLKIMIRWRSLKNFQSFLVYELVYFINFFSLI